MLDKLHDDDPIVLLPGTFVGRLNETNGLSATDSFSDAEEAARAVVPAFYGTYKVTYGTHDSDFGTPDIDANGANIVAATEGASTEVVGPVRPLGVLTAPVYSNALKTKYTNYSRDLMPSVLMGNYSVVIPAMTAGEHAIEPGDLVRVGGANALGENWTPLSPNTGVASPGRLIAYDGAVATASYVVGRCIDKYVVGSIAGADNTKVSTLLAAGGTISSQNTDHQFNTLKKVQTVPGLGLSGSGTQGIPAMFEHATIDSADNFYALVIKVDL
jgi:hypothetical protein